MENTKLAESTSKGKFNGKGAPTGSIKKRQTKSATKKHVQSVATAPGISQDERLLMIAEAAYYRAEQRGFDSQGQWQDWFEAEQQVEKMLKKIH